MGFAFETLSPDNPPDSKSGASSSSHHEPRSLCGRECGRCVRRAAPVSTGRSPHHSSQEDPDAASV
jgi:hypothetical protein